MSINPRGSHLLGCGRSLKKVRIFTMGRVVKVSKTSYVGLTPVGPVYLKKLARWNKLVNCAIPRDAETDGRDTLLKNSEWCAMVSGEPLGEQISFIVGSKTTV